ncbi:DNA (cytosine-5-)-methyltransferase [Patescibacteria group bacterium]|nr:DNA (cytosine-5-)-methyltransferase [Patescibacteria group bacterium]MBU1029072.1 DNA (cytosine-5-)-methyltransferase [Patescibacteria group bacterium]MBU1915692.1 DNA (cytosine-5-)-methyltransferase [Patescibacteria group bacterium]
MNKLLTVNETAEKLSVSSDTIRRWDKKGLIKAHRSELNYRLFDIDEVRRIHDKVGGVSSVSSYKILKERKMTPYTVVELFSGAGGTALGLENAGIRDVMLVEFDKNAAATLRRNRPDWNILEDDIHKVNFSNIKADIVEGGFPCQAFSYAGNKKGFGDTRGTLFYEFIRCVREIKPKIAVGENVRGLATHDEGRTLVTMTKELSEAGYNVAYKILRSQYLDVPQKRERLIIIGVRKDLNLPIFFPKERNYTISIREALKDCPRSEGQKYPKGKSEILKLVPPGGYWRDLPEKLQKQYMGASFYMGGGKTGMARRLAWDEPCLTLTCSPAQKQTERCHPEETRPLNIREYARIQTFPDDWEFVGSVAQQYKQIGNAVPVNLGYHIGKTLIAMLQNRYDEQTMERFKPLFFR